jgi:hypothetical protein
MDKLKIHAFKKQNFTEKVGEISLPINPESFTKNIRIDLDERRGHGNDGTDPRYRSTVPEELRLEFILDGTQTMEGYVEELKSRSVHEQLEMLLRLVSNYEGEIHRPTFLLLVWGSEIRFQCVLSTLDINYTLFNPKGEPLRAKLTANFVNYKPREERLAQERNASPDLTHYRKVKAGDRLDLMAYKIYNHSKYFLQVAQKNNLSHVRNIKPGIELYFPPFDKTEA